MMKGLQAVVSFLGAVGFASGSAFKEGTENNARYLGESDGFELFVEWRECGGPENLCSAIEECVDGVCVCPEGHVNDGFRGCIDKDECATDYPCPGIEGVSSFCVDRDPINDYYKCGCLPGYDAVYPSSWTSDIPIEFRPMSCEAGILATYSKEIVVLEGVDPDTDADELAERIKAFILADLGLRRKLDETDVEYQYVSTLQHLVVTVEVAEGVYTSTNERYYMIIAIADGVEVSTEDLLQMIDDAEKGADSSLDLDALNSAAKAQPQAAAEATERVVESTIEAAKSAAKEGVDITATVITDAPTVAPTNAPTSN